MNSTQLTGQSSLRKVAENRVITIAGYLRLGTWLLLSLNILFCLFIAAILFWSPTAPDNSLLLEQLITDGKLDVSFKLDTMNVSLQSKLLIAIYFALITLFLTYCFLQMHSLFGNFRDNKIFVKRNSELLRRLGYAFIIGFLLSKFLTFEFLSIIAALDTSDQTIWGLIDLKIRLNTSVILSILTIGVIFLFAWILDIGRELYVEAEFTI